MELIRNCSHGSEIATYLVGESAAARKIVKTASTPSGIKFLLAEVEGWIWYQKMRYQDRTAPICRIVRQRESYIKIEIDFIKGNKADLAQGLRRNAEMVNKAIKHYCAVWPGDSLQAAPLHGDLSVDNIFFNDEGLHFIDWEHFNPSGAPWGFDALYLLFETLWFGMRKRKSPTQNEMEIVRENLGMLRLDKRFTAELAPSPLRYIRDFIVANPKLWGEQLEVFPCKLPVLMFSEDQIVLIDNIIAKEV